MTEVVIVPTGTANIASVEAAFRRLGAAPAQAVDPGRVSAAQRVVLPGVGAFGAAMATVDRNGMRDALRERIEAGRPTLAVCVGMQALAEKSEESPEASGLGVVSGEVTRFPDTVRVPQLGWNRVQPDQNSRYLEPGWAYFANSYRLVTVPEGWVGATTEYGGRFVAAMERGALLACQFHPELSGAWGGDLLARWLAQGGA